MLRTSVFPPPNASHRARSNACYVGRGRRAAAQIQITRSTSERPKNPPPARPRTSKRGAPPPTRPGGPATSRRLGTQTRLRRRADRRRRVAPCSLGGKGVGVNGDFDARPCERCGLERRLVRAVERIEAVVPCRDRVLCWSPCGRVRDACFVTAAVEAQPDRSGPGPVQVRRRRYMTGRRAGGPRACRRGDSCSRGILQAFSWPKAPANSTNEPSLVHYRARVKMTSEDP